MLHDLKDNLYNTGKAVELIVFLVELRMLSCIEKELSDHQALHIEYDYLES